jgi:hypothetical protein
MEGVVCKKTNSQNSVLIQLFHWKFLKQGLVFKKNDSAYIRKDCKMGTLYLTAERSFMAEKDLAANIDFTKFFT